MNSHSRQISKMGIARLLRHRSVYASVLVSAFLILSLTELAHERLAFSVRSNMVLGRTLASLPGNVRPLSPEELVIAMRRPTLSTCERLFADLRDLATEHPMPRLFRALGIFLAVCNQPQQAELALQSAGSDSLSRMALAVVLAQQGRQADSIAMLRQVPDSAEMLAASGESAYWAGQSAEALALLEMSLAIEGSPKRSKAQMYQHLSFMHEERNHPDEAIRYAQLWVDVAPEDHSAGMLLAGLYLRRARTEDAYLVLRQAEVLGARTHPLFPGLMGRVYDQRGDLERAIPLYREAVTRNVEDPYLHWYLGQALFSYGDYQEAAQHLELVVTSPYASLQREAQSLLIRIHEAAAGAGQ